MLNTFEWYESHWAPLKRCYVAPLVFSVVFAGRWERFLNMKGSVAIWSTGISPSERLVLFICFSSYVL